MKNFKYLFLCLLLLLAACTPREVGPTPQLTLTPTTRALQVGQSTTATVNVSGFPAGVTLSAMVTNDENPVENVIATVGPIQNGRATLTVTATETAVPGLYTVTVTGTAGAVQRSATLVVEVFAAPADATLSLDFGTLVVRPGSSASTNLTLTGFTGAVALEVVATETPLPAGLTVAVDPASSDRTATVTVTATAAVPVGVYEVIIRGRDAAGASDSVLLRIEVEAGVAEPTITLAEPRLATVPTQTVTTALSVSGFNGPVTLSAVRGPDGLPSAQVYVVITPRTTSGPAELSATPVEGARSGVYLIEVEATAGDQVARSTFALEVQGEDPIGDLVVDVERLSLSSPTESAFFQLTNTANTALNWTGSIRNNTFNGVTTSQWFDLIPSEGIIPANGRQVLEVRPRPGLASGRYTAIIDIRFPGGITSFLVEANLGTATAANMSLTPTALTIPAGGTAQTTINVSGFPASVTLSARRGGGAFPDGIRVEIAPRTVPGTGSATMSITIPSGTPTSTFEIIVEASGGGVTLTRALTVNVTGTSAGTGSGSISGEVRTDNFLDLYQVPILSASLGLEGVLDARPIYVPGQLLVQYESEMLSLQGLESVALEVMQDYGLTLLRSGEGFMPDLLATSQDILALAATLSADPRVLYAEPNAYIYPMQADVDLSSEGDFGSLRLPSSFTDPLQNVRQLWNMPVVGFPVAWDRASSSTRVIAVIDTGIDLDHPDFRYANGTSIFVSTGYDFCGGRSGDVCTRDANPRPDATSDQHGTHVTGTIGAVGNNGIGVVGALWTNTRILPIKVFHNAAFTTANDLAASVRWAAGLPVAGVPVNNVPAQIINLSLGAAPGATAANLQTLEAAVREATARGSILVASAGNDGASELRFPARYATTNPLVVAVGSVNSRFQRSCFSNFGPGLTIMAAGGDAPRSGNTPFPNCNRTANFETVLSTIPGSYGNLIGTSHATPAVSAGLALVWQQNLSQTPAQVINRLTSTAVREGNMPQNEFGAGIMRVERAIGLPGPSDTVTVTATGPVSRSTNVTLLLRGNSTPYSFTALPAGSYNLRATAGALSGTTSVNLAPGENRSGLHIQLR